MQRDDLLQVTDSAVRDALSDPDAYKTLRVAAAECRVDESTIAEGLRSHVAIEAEEFKANSSREAQALRDAEDRTRRYRNIGLHIGRAFLRVASAASAHDAKATTPRVQPATTSVK